MYWIAMYLGEKLVERLFGRYRTPENRIYHAGAYFIVSMLILWPANRFMPDANPIVFIAVFCVATTIGGVVAQSIFGKKCMR
jgi:hypothetical protein